MSLKHGMTNSSTHKMLTELRQAGALEEFLENEMGFYWRATENGVSVYLGSRKAIPAGVAGELSYLASVSRSGV